MRLIDADELITAFPCGESVRTESVRATINNMPTIPSTATDIFNALREAEYQGYMKAVADRPQGKWIDEGRNLWGCSNCGMKIYSESERDRNEFHKWCSRCGARMKGADNECL